MLKNGKISAMSRFLEPGLQLSAMRLIDLVNFVLQEGEDGGSGYNEVAAGGLPLAIFPVAEDCSGFFGDACGGNVIPEFVTD